MTPAEVAALMQRRARAVTREVERATNRLGIEALSVSKRLMTQEIYSKPVDRRKNGKPKWVRTGNLRRSERLELRGAAAAGGVVVAAIVNDAAYAEPRHEANKPGRRQINPARTAHWRDDMLQQLAPRRIEIERELMDRILRNP